MPKVTWVIWLFCEVGTCWAWVTAGSQSPASRPESRAGLVGEAGSLSRRTWGLRKCPYSPLPKDPTLDIWLFVGCIWKLAFRGQTPECWPLWPCRSRNISFLCHQRDLLCIGGASVSACSRPRRLFCFLQTHWFLISPRCYKPSIAQRGWWFVRKGKHNTDIISSSVHESKWCSDLHGMGVRSLL